MKKTNYYKELEIEREKLNTLMAKALSKGIPLAEDKAVVKQSRKVDELIVKVQLGNEKQRKNQRER